VPHLCRDINSVQIMPDFSAVGGPRSRNRLYTPRADGQAQPSKAWRGTQQDRLQRGQAEGRRGPDRTRPGRAAWLRRQGQRKAAQADQAEADAALIRKVTQHWFRHRLATLLLRKDPRAAMEQGGRLDIRSPLAYSHDVPEYRRQLVAEIDGYGISQRRRR
jgi:hypothetical protein